MLLYSLIPRNIQWRTPTHATHPPYTHTTPPPGDAVEGGHLLQHVALRGVDDLLQARHGTTTFGTPVPSGSQQVQGRHPQRHIACV